MPRIYRVQDAAYGGDSHHRTKAEALAAARRARRGDRSFREVHVCTAPRIGMEQFLAALDDRGWAGWWDLIVVAQNGRVGRGPTQAHNAATRFRWLPPEGQREVGERLGRVRAKDANDLPGNWLERAKRLGKKGIRRRDVPRRMVGIAQPFPLARPGRDETELHAV